MATERAEGPHEDEHDPYARRPGYVTGPDGRTDRTTTAMVAGVVSGIVTSGLLGVLHVVEPIALTAAVVVGVAVWLLLRARRRRRDRQAGREPDAVAQARDRAIAQANGGRRYFVAQNPVVVIVMGAIFIAVAIAPVVFGEASVGRIVVMIVVVASGGFFIVQGIGTLVVRRRERSRT